MLKEIKPGVKVNVKFFDLYERWLKIPLEFRLCFSHLSMRKVIMLYEILGGDYVGKNDKSRK